MFLKIRKNIKHWTRKIKKFLIFFWRRNNNRFFFITVEKFVPKIHVNEHYSHVVKWSLRLLTVAGIVTAIVAFETWYLNLVLALTLLSVEIALERVIFEIFSGWNSVSGETGDFIKTWIERI